MKLGVWGWEGSVEGAQSPPPPPSLAAAVGKGHSLSCFMPRHLSDCRRGACLSGGPGHRPDKRAGGCPLGGPAQGQDCRSVESCSFLLPSTPRAFPAQGSPAAAARADGSRGLHGNTDVTGLESGNAASRPQGLVRQQPRAQGRWSGRPALAHPDHQRHAGVTRGG